MSVAARLQQAWLARGPLACALWPLSRLYAVLLAWRRRAGPPPERLDVPVIVVGNLVAGGAGKTPTVRALITLLRERGWQPGVISRGYGRRGDALLEVTPETPAAACGDEPLLLRLRTAAPVVVGRDRVAAARLLRERHPAVDIIVSDDGLQHRRLARDVQVIVFDERGVGNGWLLPAGPLREPMAATLPPRSLVVYNAPAPSTAWPGTLARRGLGGVLPLADWWAGTATAAQPLAALRGRRLRAVAGVARPQRFFAMLRDAGLQIDEVPLPDHHAYEALPWRPDDEIVLTEKDAVKLRPERTGATTVWVAALDFALDPAAAAALTALLPPRP